ncbi:hypothetical protein Cadr_000020640 [Camelus dromedarius]|uniref:Uncharacterized protein n=1 Tax=Camelus dromedarius TaxID=9838 RepID=A0A5N4CYR1_CAMDR|nr:hypothetical protein Cadr_000020640 [Camelus dromedarius]
MRGLEELILTVPSGSEGSLASLAESCRNTMGAVSHPLTPDRHSLLPLRPQWLCLLHQPIPWPQLLGAPGWTMWRLKSGAKRLCEHSEKANGPGEANAGDHSLQEQDHHLARGLPRCRLALSGRPCTPHPK